MPTDRPISEDELHAYVDGDIAHERRLDIALYLAHHPNDAARMEVFRAQREAIHALFDDWLRQPVPRRLRMVVRRQGVRRARRRRGTGLLVGIAVATIVLVTGSAAVRHTASDRNGAAPAAEHAPAAGEIPAIRPSGPMQPHSRNFDI
jgi:anti-sigma factor RsiW